MQARQLKIWWIAAAISGVIWLWLSATGSSWALLPGLGALVLFNIGVVSRDFRQGSMTTAALALLSNLYLLTRKIAADGESACNINQVFNCDVVNLSEWSEFQGVPITLIGSAFFAGLLLAAIVARREDPRFDQLNTFFGIFNVGYSLFLAYVSQSIGAFCIVCITIYACNAVLLWAGIKGLREHKRGLTQDLGSLATSTPVVTLLVTFGIALTVGWGFWNQASATTPQQVAQQAKSNPASLSRLYTEPPAQLTLTGQEPVAGDPNAPITLVEFADFGCPHCKHARAEIEQLIQRHPEVRLVYKYFALEARCNPSLPGGAGASASEPPSPRCDATYAAECAHQQGLFWPMQKQLFINQGYFSREQLTLMAKEAGLDTDAFTTCLDDPNIQAIVHDAGAAGTAVGVEGTPAMFVRGLTDDGRFVQLTRGVPGLLTLVEAKADGTPIPPPSASR